MTVHQHDVYFTEGDYSATRPKTTSAEDPPMVIPGPRPLSPLLNAVYLNYEHPKSHADSAIEHYYYIYSDLTTEHNQELHSDGSMKSISAPMNGSSEYY